ncbi:MAG: S1 RNA-binding domain-containing protein, partial [Anaerovoracaceae bacterium]
VFEGVISGVTGFGIYVELPNTVEGMIRLDYLEDDFYDYDKAKYRLIGRRTNKIYALGDKIQIKVQSVSIEDREINFTLWSPDWDSKTKERTRQKR